VTNADEYLFLVLGAILLVPPSDIDLLDEIGVAKGVSYGHVVAIFAKVCDISDDEGSGRTIDGLFDDVSVAYMVILGPLGKVESGVDAADEPNEHGAANGMNWSRVRYHFLVVDHVSCNGFVLVFDVFPRL
jgi:hypothetical protein